MSNFQIAASTKMEYYSSLVLMIISLKLARKSQIMTNSRTCKIAPPAPPPMILQNQLFYKRFSTLFKTWHVSDWISIAKVVFRSDFQNGRHQKWNFLIPMLFRLKTISKCQTLMFIWNVVWWFNMWIVRKTNLHQFNFKIWWKFKMAAKLLAYFNNIS